MSELILPQSEDAEKGVLGSLLLDPKQLPVVRGILAPHDFYWDRNRFVYEAILHLAGSGLQVEILAVISRLTDLGQLDAVGGSPGVAEVVNWTTPMVGETSARIVKAKSVLRRLITICHSLSVQAQEGDADAAKLVPEAAKLIGELASGTTRGGLVAYTELLVERLVELEDLAASNGPPLGIHTGLNAFDALTGGLQRKDLVLLAARPSVGKTSLALDWSITAAEHGYRVAFFSAEQSDKQIINRSLSSRWSIDSKAFLTGLFAAEDWPKMADAQHWATDHGGRLWIDDTSSPRPSEISAKSQALKLTHGLDLVVVDYLQLCDADRRVQSDTEHITNVSKGLKRAAKDLNVPVVALSQLTRDNARGNRPPMLSDLRGSGSLEQDADLVAFLHRPDEDYREHVQLLLAKQRNGPTGIVDLRFDGMYTRFTPWVGAVPGADEYDASGQSYYD